jgi:hypothetical protein
MSSKHELFNSYFVFADHEGKQAFEEDTIFIPRSSNILVISTVLYASLMIDTISQSII